MFVENGRFFGFYDLGEVEYCSGFRLCATSPRSKMDYNLLIYKHLTSPRSLCGFVGNR